MSSDVHRIQELEKRVDELMETVDKLERSWDWLGSEVLTVEEEENLRVYLETYTG